MIVVEYMPRAIRESHKAAGNSGLYPYNGAIRYLAPNDIAEFLKSEGEVRIVRAPTDWDLDHYQPLPEELL